MGPLPRGGTRLAEATQYAGWSFGPRPLVPIFGLAAVSAAFALEALEEAWPTVRAAVMGWLVFGVLYNTFVSTMFPELPPKMTAPLRMVALPLAEMSAPSPNFGLVTLGVPGLWSLLPLAVLIVGLLVYGTWPLWRQGTTSLRAGAALVATLFFFGLFAHQYPGDDARGEGLAERLAEKRTHAK